MTKFFAFLALLAAAWLFSAWMLMLTVGIIHAEWIPQLPTIAYPLSLLFATLTLARSFVGSAMGQAVKHVLGTDS